MQTASNFYWFFYPHGSRELVSSVCGIFTLRCHYFYCHYYYCPYYYCPYYYCPYYYQPYYYRPYYYHHYFYSHYYYSYYYYCHHYYCRYYYCRYYYCRYFYCVCMLLRELLVVYNEVDVQQYVARRDYVTWGERAAQLRALPPDARGEIFPLMEQGECWGQCTEVAAKTHA